MVTTTPRKQFEIVTLEPVYGINYNKGYIGFTYDGKHPVARGIAYFTKWYKMSNIHATHALIVTGENSCVEADASSDTVKESSLLPYFQPSKRQIFFRKPKDLTDDIASRIASLAQSEVGKKYDLALIIAHAFSGSFPGHLLNRLSRGKLKEILCETLDHPDKYICSELAAYVLDEQSEYRDQGVLAFPNATINPQKLFEDDVIFEPWKNKLAENLKDLITGGIEQ